MDFDIMTWTLGALLVVPALGAIASLLLRRPSAILAAAGLCVAAEGALLLPLAVAVLRTGPLFSPGGWFFMDALSAWHAMVMILVFGMASAYAPCYFRREIDSGGFTRRQAQRFGALWCAALGAMTLVLISNNIGILWVGIEATTLVTAFLICLHRSAASLEAMWKYLLICSVGVAFAFMGTLFVGASTEGKMPSGDALLWTRLMDHAAALNPTLLKVAFIFLLVGYGTKAGLAPMHSWLPDAHSQAPSPVSAIFSGFLLNAALYCILRYMALVERAIGFTGWSQNLLLLFGLGSIVVGAGFVLFQNDVKRLLAYSSMEHIGIMALGFGLAGFGTFGALFHMLNHSIAKTLSFFSAGRIGQAYGTHDMRRIEGALRAVPAWGIGLFGGLLALIGVAPLAIFMSELQIGKAAVDRGAYVTLGIFLAGVGLVFLGVLRRAVTMLWGAPPVPLNNTPDAHAAESAPLRASGVEWLLAVGPIVALLTLGLWMPAPLFRALAAAAHVAEGLP